MALGRVFGDTRVLPLRHRDSMSLDRWWARFKTRRPPPGRQPVRRPPARRARPRDRAGPRPTPAAAVETAQRRGGSPAPPERPRRAPRPLSSAGWSASLPAAAPGCRQAPRRRDRPAVRAARRGDRLRTALRASLLPRAPHVVPQLMKTLRDESYFVGRRRQPDLDATSSSAPRSSAAPPAPTAPRRRRRRDRPRPGGGDDRHRRACAGRSPASCCGRSSTPRGDTLSARAAVKIWRDADRKARLSAALAGAAVARSVRRLPRRPAAQLRAGPRPCAPSTASRTCCSAASTWRTLPSRAAAAAPPRRAVRRDRRPVEPQPGDRPTRRPRGRPARPRRGPLAARRRPARSRTGSPRCTRSPRPSSGRRAAVPGWTTLAKPVQDCYLRSRAGRPDRAERPTYHRVSPRAPKSLPRAHLEDRSP